MAVTAGCARLHPRRKLCTRLCGHAAARRAVIKQPLELFRAEFAHVLARAIVEKDVELIRLAARHGSGEAPRPLVPPKVVVAHPPAQRVCAFLMVPRHAVQGAAMHHLIGEAILSAEGAHLRGRLVLACTELGVSRADLAPISCRSRATCVAIRRHPIDWQTPSLDPAWTHSP